MDSQFFVDALLKSKSPYFLLNKNINFSKNKTEYKMENPTQIFTAAIAGHIYEIIRPSKIGQMIFQQSEHSICTSYIFTASMDRVSVANQNDLSCPLSPPHPPPLPQKINVI